MLKQVAYVTLFVRDQDKSLDFYINTLGFEKREENPAGRVKFVTVGLKGQDMQVVLWPGTPGKADPTAGPIPGTCIIDTGDLVGEFERRNALGMEFDEREPVVSPRGGRLRNFHRPGRQPPVTARP